MKDDSLALRLPAALARALARLARSRRLSRSEVVREAISAYLEPADRPPADAAARLAATDLAKAWGTLPRLSPEEAELFSSDIDRGRDAVTLADERWE